MFDFGIRFDRHFAHFRLLFGNGIRIDHQIAHFAGFLECDEGAVVLAAVTGFEAEGDFEAVAFRREVAEGEGGAHGRREVGVVDALDGGFELLGLEGLDVLLEPEGVGHGEDERVLVGRLGVVGSEHFGEEVGVDFGERELGVEAVFAVGGGGVEFAWGGLGSTGEAAVGAGGGDAAGGGGFSGGDRHRFFCEGGGGCGG